MLRGLGFRVSVILLQFIHCCSRRFSRSEEIKLSLSPDMCTL